MSNFVEVKTAELFGPALDWAVVKAADLTEESNGLRFDSIGRPTVAGDFAILYQPSVNWAQGGPLRDKFRVGIEELAFTPGSEARCWDDGCGTQTSRFSYASGGTALIAICRAIVSAKLGDVVQVPAGLVRVDS